MDKPSQSTCRFCAAPLTHQVLDLGMSPLCQTHVTAEQLNDMEPFYPLRVNVCDNCYLVQLDEYVPPDEIFTEYAYFSSYSDSWVEHARRYARAMTRRFALSPASLVMEIASNDGYALQHFHADGIPVLGIEPAANVAKVAQDKGIRTEICFHGQASAQRITGAYGQADLVFGKNVLAHVPDINDFVAGLRMLLKPGGVVTIEFPHLEKLMELNQFDTIYHEHFSYLSLYSVEQVFAAHGLTLFDVEEVPTHGGSLRVFARHAANDSLRVTDAVHALREREIAGGVNDLDHYRAFEAKVHATKRAILSFLIDAKSRGKTIVGYGAPGKGNTLLNYCGIRTDFLDYTVDRNPYKQGKYTPGTHIPILDPSAILETKPDYIFVLPWNLRVELTSQLTYVADWGGKLVFPIPEVEIIDPAADGRAELEARAS